MTIEGNEAAQIVGAVLSIGAIWSLSQSISKNVESIKSDNAVNRAVVSEVLDRHSKEIGELKNTINEIAPRALRGE